MATLEKRLDVILNLLTVMDAHKKQIKRNWSLNPENDGLRYMFLTASRRLSPDGQRLRKTLGALILRHTECFCEAEGINLFGESRKFKTTSAAHNEENIADIWTLVKNTTDALLIRPLNDQTRESIMHHYRHALNTWGEGDGALSKDKKSPQKQGFNKN